jgi:hypothetical protein
MHEKLERVKNHLAENKWKYVTGGSLLVAGTAFGYTIGNAKGVRANAAVNVNAWKSTVSVTNIAVAFEERSTPSKRVYCPELKRAFNSIHEAARETGTHRQCISRVIAGLQEATDNLTFCLIDVPE